MTTQGRRATMSAMWLARRQGWQGSEISVAEYVRREGFDVDAAYRWKRILRGTGRRVEVGMHSKCARISLLLFLGSGALRAMASVVCIEASAAASSAASPMATDRERHTANLLSGGLVLIAGVGINFVPRRRTEPYDPARNTQNECTPR